MDKIRKVYSIALTVFADWLLKVCGYPSWSYIPSHAYEKFVTSLMVRNFSPVDRWVCVTTSDGVLLLGPRDPAKFGCGNKARKRAKSALVKSIGGGPYNEADAALVHNIVLRYVTEFSPYPFRESRTRNLRAGDLFVDIGAFRGYVSLKAALLVGDRGRVISIEPIEENLDFIEGHIRLNRIKNTEIYHVAVSAEEREQINFFRTDNQRNSQIKGHIPSDATELQVSNLSVAKLAEMILCSGHARVIVSLTTNGTELEILQSLIGALKGRLSYLEITIPIIYMAPKEVSAITDLSSDSNIKIAQEYPWLKVVCATP